MIPVLSRKEVRSYDAYASSACAVPGVLLMENAGRGAAEIIARELALGSGARRRVVVVCGAGNNGGDGFVVARRLLTLGADVEAFLLVEPELLAGDALTNYRAFVGVGGVVMTLRQAELTRLGEAFEGADAVVDALLGTGLDREIVGIFRYAIEFINGAPCRRFSLDVPSGIDADSGAVLGAAVRADVTITFAHHKLGLLTPTGLLHAGRVHVVDIGVPDVALQHVGHGAEIVESSDVRAALVPRPVTTHKSGAGRVLVLAGSPGKIGASLLVARGALRAGAGLVTLGALPETAAILDQRVLEAMTARLDLERLEASLDALLTQAHAVAIGPGLGLDPVARRIVEHVVLGWDGPKVVDADAITHFAGRATALSNARGELVLTPHSGELGRLLGVSAEAVEADRFGSVTRAVEATHAVVLLKGYRTLVAAPAERIAVNPTGSPVLATGGSGDVLSGVLAALSTSLDARRAALTAAFLHGLAGERCAAERGADRGTLAHEIADAVPYALASLLGTSGAER
ncbi:MAG TPA: NAD(P)H-hydrate dehydratase [Polyangiaceae bacterium]|jgi:NAD(P)H-hydrate epimerase